MQTMDGDFRVRPARVSDLDALYAMALQTGGGFTNLPADRGALQRRLEASALALSGGEAGASAFILVIQATATDALVGTASLFTRIGVEWPFYSYCSIRISQRSVELGKTLTSDVLHLVNDFDGASEVGGLFLESASRRGGTGRLLARSRYMFIAQSRPLFADRVVADLRGFQSSPGVSPFWNAVGRHFFDMDFTEADMLNSLKGNQFIADLMPKYPIYVRLLPDDAREAIGRPHKDGEGALKLLLEEGFVNDGYIDIFDAGPTVHAQTDRLRAVAQSEVSTLVRIEAVPAAPSHLIARGELDAFRATAAPLSVLPDGACVLGPGAAKALEIEVGDEVRHVRF